MGCKCKLDDNGFRIHICNNCKAASVSDSPALAGYVAVTQERHPLDGGPVPVLKSINRETTVGDLLDWYEAVHGEGLNPYDLRIVRAT